MYQKLIRKIIIGLFLTISSHVFGIKFEDLSSLQKQIHALLFQIARQETQDKENHFAVALEIVTNTPEKTYVFLLKNIRHRISFISEGTSEIGKDRKRVHNNLYGKERDDFDKKDCKVPNGRRCKYVNAITKECGCWGYERQESCYCYRKGFFDSEFACIAFLESLADTTAPWITVDEIGYLENTSYDYQKAFERLMNKKRIIMVVRKQDLSFLNWLCSHKDVFLVDLDRPFGNSGCIIMASGQGKRFGSNKLMAEYHGQPLIKWILDITKDLFARRLVVTIHQDIEKLCTEYSIPVILHSSPYRNDMIRLGLDTIGSYIDRCAFIPSDQPLIKTESIASLLLCAQSEPSYIWRTCYDKTPGAPVIFPKEYFDELMSLPQGKGGNVVVHSHESQVRQLPVTSKTELMDIDTPADMARLKERP